MTETPERTALYRHFDAAGRLLYVGISKNPHSRTKDHLGAAHWKHTIEKVKVEWYSYRSTALEAEASAIVRENPLHNLAGRLAIVEESETMPRPKLAYLQRETARGKTFWYVRLDRKSPRIRIRGDYGSPEFMKAYRAAISGEIAPKARAMGDGTLEWLVDRWKVSSDWNLAAPATKRQRENYLRHILEKSGDVDFAAITEDDIRAGMERRQATPFAADNFLKLMRALFKWAKEARHVTVDPTLQVMPFNRKTEGFTPWTAADVALYRARWPLGTRERVAGEILFNTGLRRSDVVRLGRQHVKDGVATIKTFKGGVTVHLPLMPALLEAIEAGPVGDLAFAVSSRGTPWAKEAFTNWFREVCDAAGIAKGKSAHGIRKLLATTIAEDGASERELMAFFGWKTNAQSLDYTKDIDNKRLALGVALRLMGDESDGSTGTKRGRSIP